jgi:Concanavalin A-like lectin/glucanases superfamily
LLHCIKLGISMLVGIGGFALSIGRNKSAFDPKSITGLLAWISADSGIKDSGGNVITADNTTVYTATDRGSLGNNLVNSAGTGPKWRNAANGINGLPVLQFDGSTQFLNFASNVTPTANFTYVIVCKPTRTGTYGFQNRVQGTVNGGSGITLGLTTTNAYVVFRTAGGTLLDFYGNATCTNQVVATMIAGTGGGKLRVNKTEIASNASATAWGLSGAATEYVGRDPGTYFQGAVCEILIYNTILSANNLSLVENYLSSKWNT